MSEQRKEKCIYKNDCKECILDRNDAMTVCMAYEEQDENNGK